MKVCGGRAGERAGLQCELIAFSQGSQIELEVAYYLVVSGTAGEGISLGGGALDGHHTYKQQRADII